MFVPMQHYVVFTRTLHGEKCAYEQKLLQVALILLCDSCIPTGCTHGDKAAKLELEVICSSGEDMYFC